MGDTGLSERPLKRDNLFQRLLWPSNHAGQSERLGEQGYLLCAIVAAVAGAALGFEKQYTASLLTFVFFFLGAIGVRAHEPLVANLLATGYVLNTAANWISGSPPGVFTIAGAILLIANVRVTIVANRWATRHQHVSLEKLSADWSERLLDELPVFFWPRVKIAFRIVAIVYLLLILIGIATLIFGRMHSHGVQ